MFQLPVRSVLVPTDFSPASDEALATASRVLAPGGELHVVHVIEDLSGNELGVFWGTIDDAERVRRTTAALERAVLRAGLPNAKLHVEIVPGNPANGVVQLAGRLGVELVVMPSLGRTGIARIALGSTAERVVRLAPCPVLVLRAPSG